MPLGPPRTPRVRTALVVRGAALLALLVAVAAVPLAHSTAAAAAAGDGSAAPEEAEAAWVPPVPLPSAGPARPFQAPAHRYGPGHRGVDLLASDGEAVRAAGAGTVAFAGPVAGRPVVSVDHPGGLRTTYEPVDAAVRRGDPVEAGEVLGRLTAAGSHCAPAACLHWGVRTGPGLRDYLDPLALLAPGPPRLLPLADGGGAGGPSPDAEREAAPAADSPGPHSGGRPPLTGAGPLAAVAVVGAVAAVGLAGAGSRRTDVSP